MWFENLTGFAEESPNQVRASITLNGNIMKSQVNGREFIWGELETPSLAELRQRVGESTLSPGKMSFREVVADVQQLHMDEENAGALFQVASQFNLLEMTGPAETPEMGVGIYEYDRTQGPACAIACGAGTIHRNYFAEVNGQTGQTADNQIDCLAELGEVLGNTGNRLWEMRNGYCLPTQKGLSEISDRLKGASESVRDELRGRLRIGIQRETQVTLGDCSHTVSQAYCSALPVAYSSLPPRLWEEFARLVLEAAYEATILAAILNSLRSGKRSVFLTLLGGGAFGNETGWIIAAIRRAQGLHRHADLDVAIVSYGSSKEYIRQLVDQCNG